MKTIQASQEEIANDIIERAGIEVIDLGVNNSTVFFEYEGKRIVRPPVYRWEEVVFEQFGIKIEYAEKAQLKLFTV